MSGLIIIGLILCIGVIILLGFITYKLWKSLFDVIYENKHMKIISIILGILWPISCLVLFTIVMYYISDYLNDYLSK